MMITNILVIICAVVFLYIQFINKDDKISCAMRLGAFYPPHIIEKHEYWRFITCHFIHIDFMHFLLNAYALYDLGRFFESLLTTRDYLLLVVLSMLLSGLMCYSASQFFNQHTYRITIGASGIVYGFFGAIVGLGLLVGGVFSQILSQFLWIVIINVMYTLFNRQVSSTGHFGGFIGGFLAIVIILFMHTNGF